MELRLFARDREQNWYIYNPNLPAAIVALCIWIFVLIAIVYRSCRFRIWYLTVMIVGLLSMSRPEEGTKFSGDDRIRNAHIWMLQSQRI